MNTSNEIKPSRSFLLRLPYDCDLLQELNRVCSENRVTLGRLEAIGAVRSAQIGFYDQINRSYEFTTIARPLEIVKLTGNISLKDGKPFVHAHIALADRDGSMYGGHLAEGTVVFACECLIQSFDGPPFERKADTQTGLSLWAEA